MEQKDIIREMKERFDLEKIKDLIKDNVISFDVGDKTYRVRMLKRKEKDELNFEKQKNLTQMLRDKTFERESVLINLWKEKGVDIRAMDEEYEELGKKEQAHRLSLGELLKKKASAKECQVYRDKIASTVEKKLKLNYDRYSYLSSSLENQLINFHYKYLTYLCLEIKDGENWKKYFKNYEEYCDCEDEKLIEEASYNVSLLYT